MFELIFCEPTAWHWVAFGGLIALLLAIDLVVFHRHEHEPSLRESALWSVAWIGVALAFNAFVWMWRGHEYAALFLTGYLVEKSLSVDNLFVFAVIFSYFKVPMLYQHRVLFWGVAGAVFARLAFIMTGAVVLENLAWVSVIFGALLIYTAAKLLASGEAEVHPERNWFMRAASRIWHVATEHKGKEFFVRQGGVLCMTPLFLVLIVIESTDILFAVDSVPAVLSITTDKFTVFTSNVFAILGLRALYFLLAGVMGMFRYLNYGLSAVLAFLGSKMIFGYWTGHELTSPLQSLGVIMGLIGAAVVASVLLPKNAESLEIGGSL